LCVGFVNDTTALLHIPLYALLYAPDGACFGFCEDMLSFLSESLTCPETASPLALGGLCIAFLKSSVLSLYMQKADHVHNKIGFEIILLSGSSGMMVG